jgi:L-erythro-3,5-diaminohexanoate dehydrogenase
MADVGVKHLESLGCHRVVEPRGALPQAAERLDADPARRHPDEIHIDVETLNVDSASFRQIEEEQRGDPERIARRIVEIVNARGKLQNPVTGSGGMLLGRVAWIGAAAAATATRCGVAVGDRVATLVSLTLTPLRIERVLRVRPESHQVDVAGTAVLFTSGTLARMPADLPERLALALFDVAGAAPQVARLAAPGQRILVLGAGGKSGLLASVAARRRVGEAGTVVGVEPHAGAAAAARALGIFTDVFEVSAADPVACVARTGDGYDLVVSCVNVAGAELAAILATRPRGRVYFFSMSTSFARAALGAEGVARDVDLYIGNGYCEGHAEATLALVRDEPALKAELSRRFA